MLLIITLIVLSVPHTSSLFTKVSSSIISKPFKRSATRGSSTSSSDLFDVRVPQRVVITEPTTGVNVVLIGTMHYNPTSIELARSTVSELGDQKSLYSVVVESCPARWNKAQLTQPTGSLMSKIFENEMQSASDAALVYNRPVVLGDQDFNATTKRMKEVFVQSIKDVFTPLGGWQRLYSDISSYSKLLGGNNKEDNFGPSDLLDPALLVKAPISILRYAFSILIKAPKVGIPIFALFAYSVLQSSADDLSTASIDSVSDPNVEILVDSLATVGVNLLQVALLGRVFLQALLFERNEIIADNILAECKKAKASGGGRTTVVAVLGMAHCNGVKSILLTQ